MTGSKGASLPQEIADRFTKIFARFLKIEAAASGLLLLALLLALSLANSPWALSFEAIWETPIGLHFGSLDFTRSLRHWINDGLMTFFFFVISLELKREIVLGELRIPRRAALPFAAALGGMIVPVSIYLVLIAGNPGIRGWGTVMATDTAFAIGCLALFGRRIPPSLRLFLLSLAIFDDVGAILVVAVFYGEAFNWTALGAAVLGFGLVASIARLGIRSMPIYFLAGGAIWLCVDASGLHATIAGVLLGLMTPTQNWVSDTRLRAILEQVLTYPGGEHWSGDTPDRHDLREAGRAVSETLSPVERLEIVLHPWVGFAVMPVFALANAGISIDMAYFGQQISLAIVAGLVLGKPLGVLGFSWAAVRLGFAVRHPDLSWPFLTAGAFLAGIGFTMSLFIANLAFDQELLGAAKLGILMGSAVSAIIGLLALLWLVTRSDFRRSGKAGEV
ncbi:Putative transport protein [Stappia aggregata IAM 12614]|uniref:Na(+)/H(+) antiporter NhaA n=1 Tax=Roseibium aggregatum (strain ATCC 25650 / DSM 13394 / JCM 20685 / NBRC 16684 / NCIMB 2208 / IAM 12614 / B1) TaxID=384765 RepID=A0P171_ROSAI|nr:Na+/H+ antiporter NhaA [Roseibium aggregatum]EAV41256.1 Putative transport protein [Stappia aggregata IAM 12614] [Roseibium aggregatum IAM 12614]